jgi:coproporphyrinogen III oxidase-like Fe-S oxidoreductase
VRQAEGMEAYFERVVARLTAAGYRWYETANFCLAPDRDSGRDLRARHNLAYWQGRDYLGLGIGAVSTLSQVRRRNAPKLGAYVAALARRDAPPRELEALDDATRVRERVMLGLRLDEPLPLSGIQEALDTNALRRLERLGLVRYQTIEADGGPTISLSERGRFLGGAITADLLE